MPNLRRIALALALFPALFGAVQAAPPASAPAPATTASTVGFPQDAGPHDASAAIEWWYFNTFLTTEKGHHYAVIGAFFRTGLAPTQKGHYLIYALADLDAKSREPFALIDHKEVDLLSTYLSLNAMVKPSDLPSRRLLSMLRQGKFPPPLRLTEADAAIETTPRFSLTLDNNSFSEETPDGRTWHAALNGDDWTLDLTLDQPDTPDRPPMRVDGIGLTGLKRPDDMHYVSLTRMSAKGTLTDGGVVDKVTGTGWLDRQWGTSWVVQDNGWDWFGLHLDDGAELIVYRIRDNKTGKILRSDATLLDKNGVQTVESEPVLLPDKDASSVYTDPETHIAFPQSWTIALPKIGLMVTAKSAFPEQTMPITGIGDAIWEGVVDVSATRATGGATIGGRGYMELVGYHPATVMGKTATPAVGTTPPAEP